MGVFDLLKHHRRSIRLKGYDYTHPGVYFVTIVAFGQEPIFGRIVEGEMELNQLGEIILEEWFKTAQIRPEIELDEFVVMPNHVHGIIWIVGARRRRAPTLEDFRKPVPGSIPTIVRSFKSTVTRRINLLRKTSAAPVWQRNYYEHVIKSEKELGQIRQYIRDNPLKWETDQEYPGKVK